MRRILLRSFVCLLVFGVPLAEGRAEERGTLEVAGAIAGGKPVRLDRAALQAMGVARLNTGTPWTEGSGRFEGVLLRDLLAGLGAYGTHVRAEALNDYAAVIPLAEAERYDVLVAWSIDGRLLSRRDKGPFWIVYPWSDHPELDTRDHRQRSVWQLVRLVVE